MGFEIFVRMDKAVEGVTDPVIHGLTEFHPAVPVGFAAVFEDTDGECGLFAFQSGFDGDGFFAGDYFAGSGRPEPADAALIFQKGGDGTGIAGDLSAVFCAPEENFSVIGDIAENLFAVFNFYISGSKAFADVETGFFRSFGFFQAEFFSENFAQVSGKLFCRSGGGVVCIVNRSQIGNFNIGTPKQKWQQQ